MYVVDPIFIPDYIVIKLTVRYNLWHSAAAEVEFTAFHNVHGLDIFAV